MSKILGLKKRIKSIANIGRITNTLYKVSLSYVSYWEAIINNTKEYHKNFLGLIAPIQEEIMMHLQELSNAKSRKKTLVVWGPRQGLCGSLIPKLKQALIDVDLMQYSLVIVINHRIGDYVQDVLLVDKLLSKSNKVDKSNRASKVVNVASNVRKKVPQVKIIETQNITSAQDLKTFVNELIQTLMQDKIYDFDVIYPFYLGNLDFKVLTTSVNVSQDALENLQKIDDSSTDFKSSLNEQATQNHIQNNANKTDTPAIMHIDVSLDEMAQVLMDYQLYVNLLVYSIHSLTSESIARMVAMKNATDNTNDMLETLQLQYNRQRQANITNELLDIANAKRAME